MRHANEQDLRQIAALLEQLRALGALVERKPGIFYSKSRAFLHFHEHDGTLYADVRLGGPDFERFALEDSKAQRELLTLVRQSLTRGR